MTKVISTGNFLLNCYSCNIDNCTIDFVVYKKCSTSFRHIHYKVDHDQYGVDPSSCKRCMCENGQFNMSTCDNSHNCTLIKSASKNNCYMGGKQYRHQQVFPVDKCNKCKCFNGKISGCTRRKCVGGDDTPCDKCKKLHRKPVCGPNGVTYDNICAAKYCAEFDPIEVIPGPCSIQVYNYNYVIVLYKHSVAFSMSSCALYGIS